MIYFLQGPFTHNKFYLKEFAIVIPDEEADLIETVDQGTHFIFPSPELYNMTVSSAVDYIAKTPEGLLLFLNLLLLAHIYSLSPYSPLIWNGTRGAQKPLYRILLLPTLILSYCSLAKGMSNMTRYDQ